MPDQNNTLVSLCDVPFTECTNNTNNVFEVFGTLPTAMIATFTANNSGVGINTTTQFTHNDFTVWELPDFVKRLLVITGYPETMEGLMKYAWPGNVRELENLLKRALLLSKSNVITPDLISAEINSSVAVIPGTSGKSLSSLLPGNLEEYEGILFKHVIEQVERELIEKALAHSKGNQVKTAKLLGISRAMLHERMEKFGLLPE